MSESTKRSLGIKPLLYPEPVLLVGSYDADNKPNLMTAAWGGICNSNPVSLMIALRPATYSHDCIIQRKAFTVGIASEKILQAADFIGIASGRNADKFVTTGLTPVRAEKVDAPYAEQCPVILECELVMHQSLGLHTIFVGTIQDVKVDENCLNSEGNAPDINKIAPIIFDSGTRSYFGIGSFLAKAFDQDNPLLKK